MAEYIKNPKTIAEVMLEVSQILVKHEKKFKRKNHSLEAYIMILYEQTAFGENLDYSDCLIFLSRALNIPRLEKLHVIANKLFRKNYKSAEEQYFKSDKLPFL